MTNSSDKSAKLLLVSSSGGHLTETASAWENYERVWVSFKQPDVQAALENERVHWAYYPTTRNIKNAIRNFFLALKVIPQEKPQAVVSAGAGVAVPFFVAAKLFRVKTMYIECYDRPTLPTMTGKMLYILADSFNVQNEEQQKNFPDSTILHPIF